MVNIMSTPQPDDQALLREQIQTAIAAGRELGPDMDPHLADSVISRYQKERDARNKALSRMQPAATLAVSQRSGSVADAIDSFFRGIASLGVIGGITAAIVLSGGSNWWLIFIMMPAMGIIWGTRDEHHSHASERQSLKLQARNTRRRLEIERMQAEIDRLRSSDD